MTVTTTRKAVALGLLGLESAAAPVLFPLYHAVLMGSAVYHVLRGTTTPLEYETPVQIGDKHYVATVRFRRA